MARDTVEVSILRGSSKLELLALDIDGTRVGPDAGPWAVVATFRIDPSVLAEALVQFMKGRKAMKESLYSAGCCSWHDVDPTAGPEESA